MNMHVRGRDAKTMRSIAARGGEKSAVVNLQRPDRPNWSTFDFSVLSHHHGPDGVNSRCRDIKRTKDVIAKLLRKASQISATAKEAPTWSGEADEIVAEAQSYYSLAGMAARLTRPFSDFEISPTSPRPDCRVSAEQWAADGHPVTFGRGPTRYGNSVFATVAEG